MRYLIEKYIKIKTKINNRKFLRDILFISGGATLAQGLNIILSPIITRIYLPEEYGVMAILTSILMILSFPSLMYEMAIPMVKDERKAINVAMLSFIILVFFVFSLTIILIIIGDLFLDLINASQLVPYKYFISIGVFLIGLYNILIHWMYRRKNFFLISKTQIGQSIAGNISKISFGYFGFGASGLVIGTIIKQSAGIISLIKYLFLVDKDLFKAINLKDMLLGMKKYKDFPFFQTPIMILLRIKNQIPVLSLAFYGTQIVGLYGFANTIIKLPMILVGQSITKVFYAEVTSIGKENPDRILSLSNKLFKKLAVFGFFPILLLAIFGPHIISFAFGHNWYEAGVFVRILALSIYADFIFSPTSRVYEVLERQKEKMIIDLFGLVLIIIAFSSARLFNMSPYIAILLYSLSMSLIYLVTYFVAKVFLTKEIKLKAF